MAQGTASDVATSWSERLAVAPAAQTVGDLYGGRGFTEARRAADHVSGRLAIISAGLGLVDSETKAPAYSLTTARGDADDIRLKTGGGRSEWWAAIQAASPFAAQAPMLGDGLILAAVSSAYLEMVAAEWSAWPASDRARLRLFSKEAPQGAGAILSDAWMPYDDRLDAVRGDLAGTQGDFAQRALRHFATEIAQTGSPYEDAAQVSKALHGLSAREVPVRRRMTDDELKQVIRENWAAANGQSTIMLRRLRDTLGLACEQGRFQGLFHAVKAERVQ
ncbi:hypothetical protein [Brevundimonas nasdae]|uniref:Uncharacterized protein n=1 Tax=Brevundimonas nasdae TaxID=172043 RepID=A0ABX8TJU7_9CAUL|nr:hypothetical protein [Brevundimonas nasdae]QYC11497.1 hypothetical protein KWG56_05840 [Brevundimonas nasdae]QYC14285.1 hypothetical protein KWG63_01175 [Brevundimonas nasdae]